MSATTFSFETLALRSVNYLERLVDARGIPYFNVFWTDPAEAAHDWPDVGDVMSRQLQAAIMLRRMTGRTVSTEDTWQGRILSFIDPGDGLLYRPAAPWAKREADWGDAALTLYALAAACADSGDPEVERVTRRMAEGLHARAEGGDPPKEFRGFIVKSLMACARILECGPALALARTLVEEAFRDERIFTRDGAFRSGGHMHGNLRALVGAADYALFAGDAGLLERVDASYRWVRNIGTRFGWLPEVYARKGDIVLCETCALMDFAGLGSTLANHGRPGYWGDMERLARNHLAESQLADASWLRSENARPDTAQFSWRQVGARALGAWAGWSSPNHFLAACETLDAHWGTSELRGKPRALQNCCGGSGVHALFILWKNSARFENGTAWVHMHLDKLLPEFEVRCLQPWKGVTRVAAREACSLRVRVPDFTEPGQLEVRRDGLPEPARLHGGYLAVDGLTTGQVVEVRYPLPVSTEEAEIGNPGWRKYRYRVTWKGDTVVRMEPLGNEAATGWSDFDKKEVPVFYGSEGPAPLYRRDHMSADAEPGLAPLHEDDGSLDFWRFPQALSPRG